MPPPARPIDVSAVIVTWNPGELLERCVGTLESCATPLELEIIISDNASSDGAIEAAEARHPGLTVLRHQHNHGFAGATNAGIRASHGRYVLILNVDTEAIGDPVTAMAAYLDANPRSAAVAPLLLNRDGTPQRGFQLHRFPTFLSMALELLLVDKVFPNNYWSRHYRCGDLDYAAEQDVEQPAGAALLARREALLEVGLFDARFTPAWFEDVDLCYRLHRGGWTCRFLPRARFYHEGGAALLHLSYAEFLNHWYRNFLYFIRKHFSPLAYQCLRGLMLGGMVLRALAVRVYPGAVPAPRAEALRAYGDVFRGALGGWKF